LLSGICYFRCAQSERGRSFMARTPDLRVEARDPFSEEALFLLHEAALEGFGSLAHRSLLLQDSNTPSLRLADCLANSWVVLNPIF
jgi:hypothetical protein